MSLIARHRVAACALWMALFTGCSGPGSDVSGRVPITTFQALAAASFDSVQVKVMYLADGHEESPPIILAVDTTAASVESFAPYERSDFPLLNYGNSLNPPRKIVVSRAQMIALIRSIAEVRSAGDGGVDSTGYVGLAIVKPGGTALGFESVLAQGTGTHVMRGMMSAVADNEAAHAELMVAAREYGMLPRAGRTP